MPAPKRTPDTPAETPAETPAAVEANSPQKGEPNPFIHSLLQDAQTLKDEKTALLARIDDNRTTLRTVARTGFLSKEQAAAIVEWYPMPNRHKKGENGEATTDQPSTETTEAAA